MDITIRDENIRLGQALKLAGIASTGAEAKRMIGDGLVAVNEEMELRRGRKLYDGDVVTANGETFYVHSEAPAGGLS